MSEPIGSSVGKLPEDAKDFRATAHHAEGEAGEAGLLECLRTMEEMLNQSNYRSAIREFQMTDSEISFVLHGNSHYGLEFSQKFDKLLDLCKSFGKIDFTIDRAGTTTAWNSDGSSNAGSNTFKKYHITFLTPEVKLLFDKCQQERTKADKPVSSV